jgi:hypothetical protein
MKNGISGREKVVNERIQSCIKELTERVSKKKEKVREKSGEKDN